MFTWVQSLRWQFFFFFQIWKEQWDFLWLYTPSRILSQSIRLVISRVCRKKCSNLRNWCISITSPAITVTFNPRFRSEMLKTSLLTSIVFFFCFFFYKKHPTKLNSNEMRLNLLYWGCRRGKNRILEFKTVNRIPQITNPQVKSPEWELLLTHFGR